MNMELQQNMSMIIVMRLHMSFTICFTVFYSLIFLIAYIQLWLVLYLKHKLVSAQTLYFLLCSIFTSQRIVLFSFFYEDISDYQMNTFLFWFLHSLPVVIHYMIILLITVFYYRQYIKSKGFSSKLNCLKIIKITIPIFCVFVLQLLTIWTKEDNNSTQILIHTLEFIKNIGTDLIFLGTISFFVHIYKQFPNFPNALLVSEAKRITKNRIIIVGTICLTVSILKFSYDIVALIFLIHTSPLNLPLPTNINTKDFLFVDRSKTISFLIFGIVLFSWEVIPLIAAMILFRVNLPKGLLNNLKPAFKKSSNPNSVINSTITNSANTTKSKFIGVPKYGALSNSGDTSSGPLSPSYFDTPHVLPYSIQRNDVNFLGSENTSRHFLGSNIYSDSCNIQRERTVKPKSCKQQGKRLLNQSNQHIWRSSSNKCLTNSNTIARGTVVKANSTYLSTANEE